MVLFTSQATAQAGGRDAILLNIQQAIIEANQVFQNSQVNARLQLVHADEISYSETGSVAGDMARLRDPSDPELGSVRKLRDQFAADLVCLVTESGYDLNFAGLPGPSSENPFSIVPRRSLTGFYYFPVALSFNFGCQMERGYATGVGAFPYAYGYSFWGGDRRCYSTVEAFAGQRLPFFSNPLIQYQGFALGIADGTPNAADNARVINQTAPIVASFRGASPTTLAPVVSLTAPTDQGSVFEGEPVEIKVATADADGFVARVDVYIDDAWLGSSTNGPYSFAWTNAAVGPHALKAVAIDNQGAMTVSDPISITVRPGNDNFDVRTALMGSNIIVRASNVYATSEPGEPQDGGIGGGHSLWWSWTAPTTGMVEINTLGSTFNTVVAVFTGDSLGALALVANSNYQLGFMAIQGQTYQIAIDGAWGAAGNIVLNICPPRPPNDDFANRTILAGNSLTVQGSNIGATLEPGENLWGWYGNFSVWWTWTAPDDGNLHLQINSQANWGCLLSVFTGDSLDNLVAVASNMEGLTAPSVDVPVVKNTVYQIGVANNGTVWNPNFDLDLTFALPPPNDNFANRTILTGNWVLLTNSSLAATTQQGEPGAGNSIWWSWTAPFAGHVTFMSPSGQELDIYSGDTLSNLTLICGGQTNSFETEAGATCQIAATGTPGEVQLSIRLSNVRIASPGDGAVAATGSPMSIIVTDAQTDGPFDHVDFYADGQWLGGASGNPSAFVWTNAAPGEHEIDALAIDLAGRTWDMPGITLAVRPPNDDFANRIELTGTSVNVTGNDQGATWEPNDPTGWALDPSHMIWYEWTAPADGKVGFAASGNYANFVIFEGTELTNLVAIAGTPMWWQYLGQSVSFHTKAGQIYQIAIEGLYVEGDLNFDLELYATPVPPNDNFASATALSGFCGYLQSYTTNATREVGELLLAANANGQTVWWQWTAPINGLATLLPQATSFSSAVGVFVGETVSKLVFVTNGSTASPLSFFAHAGTTYRIAVDGLDQQLGVVSMELAISPPNDDFESRTTIEQTPAVLTPAPSLFAATAQDGEPILGMGHTVWWTWTAPMQGRVTLTQSPNPRAAAIGVYVGDSVSNLTQVAAQTGWPVTFFASAGTVYQIAIDAADPSTAPWDISIQMDFAPSYISIASPVAGQTMWIGNPLPVVPAIDSRFGPVQHVDYYMDYYYGDTWAFASATNSPYVGLFAYGVEGDETLTAVATSVSGQTTESPAILVHVLFPRLTNDNFADRVVIGGTNYATSGSIEEATAEPGEPNHGGQPASHSVWWTWTAPADGGVCVTTTTPYFSASCVGTTIEVYSGNHLTNLISISSDCGDGRVTFNATAGCTYQIAVDGYLYAGFLTFQLTLQPPPVNDHFINRIPITGTNITVHGTTVGATPDAQDAIVGGLTDYHSIWWSWTAPLTGMVQIDSGGSSQTVLLAALKEPTLEEIACQMNFLYKSASRFLATAGTTYDIMATTCRSAGDVTVNIRQLPPPQNDNFANRIALSGAPLTISGCNYFATRETNEPSSASYYSGSSSVWWSWTAPASGNMTVDYLSGNFIMPPAVEVFGGNALTNLAPVFRWTEWGYPKIHYVVSAGATYQIRFQGNSGEYGEFVLQLDAPAPAGNDLFSNRTLITGSSLVLTGTTAYARSEPGEPNTNGNSIWWSWQAPADGAVRLSANGGGVVVPLVSVFTGDSLSNLVVVGRAPNKPLFIPVRAGTNYAIAVETVGATGTVSLALEMLDPPANDAYASRIAVSGPLVTLTSTNWGATREPGEVASAQASVWWSWTAPVSGPVTINANGLDFTPVVSVFSGDSLTTLVPLNGSPSPDGSLFQVVAGSTYAISVDGTNGTMGTFDLQIASRPIRLSSPTNLAAYCAPANIELRAEAANPAELARVDFFAGTNLLGSLNVPPFEMMWAKVGPGSYDLTAAATDQRGNVYPTYTTKVTVSPNNDLFANRILLGGDAFSFDGSNSWATAEPGEWLPDGASGKTLWWSWTAPSDGIVNIGITGFFSGPAPQPYGPLAAVYTGTNLASLNLWASNMVPPTANQGEWSVQPSFAFPVSSGQSYPLSVDGVNGSSGNFAVSMSFTPTNPPPAAPVNDNFSNRLSLAGASLGTTVSATTETGEPTRGLYGSPHSVWWTWTAPTSGTATLAASNDNAVGLIVSLYTGSALTNLAPVAESQDSVQFWAVAGVTYQIAVTSPFYAQTAFLLQLTAPPSPPSIAPQQYGFLTDGRFVIGISGISGQSYKIQSSSDLIHWQTIGFDALIDTTSTFVDGNVDPAQRFYRVLPLDYGN